MEPAFDEDVTFTDLKPDDLAGYERTFESCKFINCDFSYADLTNMTFISCVMDKCNLSLVKVDNAGFQGVEFKGCKITGVNFSNSSTFSFAVGFEHCLVDYTIFHKKKMKGTRFTECSLVESDFTEAELTNAVFYKCNLNRTIFSRTILKGADFTTAYNFDIDPENNTMAKAKFTNDMLAGLLTKYNLIIE